MALQQLGSARKVPGGTDQCLLPKTQESLPLPSDFLDLGVQDLLHSQPLDAVTLPNRESLDYLRSSGRSLSRLALKNWSYQAWANGASVYIPYLGLCSIK